ncbi:MAG: hypothetical protein VKM92_05000 [Cyanobacteriota bacterium]|nr:hypothetical protein [Cyanobacteriota bacterium]
MQQTYLSRSRSQKCYVFGTQQVTIRPAAAWNFLLPDRPAGQAIRALTWLGPDQASAALPELCRVLPPVEWDALLSVRAELPLWLAELLRDQPLESQKAHGGPQFCARLCATGPDRDSAGQPEQQKRPLAAQGV